MITIQFNDRKELQDFLIEKTPMEVKGVNANVKWVNTFVCRHNCTDVAKALTDALIKRSL